MVGLEQTEERPCRLTARLESDGRRLDHRAGDLVLEALARQVEPWVDLGGVPVLRPEQLQRVGGEAGGARKAAVRDPRVPAALRQILPAHHHRSAARVVSDVVVDVLRRVGFVAHEEAAIAQADVLHQDRITRHWLRVGVRDLDPPQPELVLGVQPKGDGVPQAADCPVPREAIGGGAEADLRRGADRLRDRRRGRADAQVQAGDATAEGRAFHLVDHDPAALVLALDREDAPVGQSADRQAGWVRDAMQAEIAGAGHLERAHGKRRHP